MLSFRDDRAHPLRPWTVPHGPLVWIAEPRSGTTVSGVVSVSAAASSLVGLFQVAFFVDGVSRRGRLDGPYGFAWATSEQGNGGHTLTARAVDARGRTVEQAVKVQVSN